MTTRSSWMNGRRPRPSSITLRGMEIAVPPGQRLSAEQQGLPPPSVEDVAEHRAKPLPVPPPTRHSAASSLSKQLDLAFSTPYERAPQYRDGSGSPWSENEDETMADMLDKVGFSPDRPVSHVPLPIMNTKKRIEDDDGEIPNTPDDQFLAGRSKMSVQKILRVTRDPNQAIAPRRSRSDDIRARLRDSWLVLLRGRRR
jgi:hypothetical protein